jgi:hypothetical protein
VSGPENVFNYIHNIFLWFGATRMRDRSFTVPGSTANEQSTRVTIWSAQQRQQ